MLDDYVERNEAEAHLGTAVAVPMYETPATGFEPTEQPIMLETGYVSAGLHVEEAEIFSLDRVQFQLPSKLNTLAVSNNIMVMALETNHLLRIDLQQAHDIEDIELPKKNNENTVYKIFLDPSGKHLIITTEQGDNYYLYEKWKKPKALSKYKGIVIESIAWSKSPPKSTAPSTKEILIGVRNGTIYEGELEATDDYFKRGEKYLKQVYSLREALPITGLRYEQFPTGGRKYLVVATTLTRLYQFVGNAGAGGSEATSMFEPIFANYLVNPGFQELPSDLPYSELHFFTPYQELQYQGLPTTFAWMTGPGIYHGNLVFGSQNTGDSVIDSAMLLPYPAVTKPNGSDTNLTPLSIALAEFHFIVLYGDRVRAINMLNDRVVYEERVPLRADQFTKCMAVDPVKNTFWIYTDSAIYELVCTREDRDVWKLYLEKKMFDTALRFCKDPAQRDMVLTTQAEHYFSQGRYLLSANYYAQSTVAFEEVALKFVERDERDALRMYLVSKLDGLKKSNFTQRTIIATWLVEIHLNKLNLLEDLVASVANTSSETECQNYREEQKVSSEEFRSFLETYRDNLDRKTTYNLIASHGRVDELLFYATLIGDYEKVISHYLQDRNYKQALDVLSKHASTDLYYKFSPTLMEHVPEETVNIWMRKTNLNPQSMIPALLKYNTYRHANEGTDNQAIRYLQYVVQRLNNRDPAIHNYLLTLYATQPTKDETPLLVFLESQGKEMHFNLDYALRLCVQNGRMQSCVHIYSNMGLYEEAVDLALKYNDLELARINADKPEDDVELRKKLWLRIARHVVEKKKDIKTAMEYLQRSDLLKIEDVLPFFPDFVLIDDFKDEICSALEVYNIHIDELKSEMDEATRSAESIRLDIRELRSRFAVIAPLEKCCLCDFLVLTRQFYIFPCQHAFHADCLIAKVTRLLPPRQYRKILDIQDRIRRDLTSNGTDASSTTSTFQTLAKTKTMALNPSTSSEPSMGSMAKMFGGGMGLSGLRDVIFQTDSSLGGANYGDDVTAVVPKLDGLKEELDDLIASECILCGEMMIKSVDVPFIGPEESDLVTSWAI